MSKKHLATIVIAFFIVCVIQASLSMQGVANKRQLEANAQVKTAAAAQQDLGRQRKELAEFKKTSSDLVDYLQQWQPYFSETDSAQRAELNISLRIKEDNLVGLSQRYELVTLKGNPSVTRALRAYLTFEDDYSRLLNWLGTLETNLPTLRINSVQISKGTAANDIRMTLVLDQPLMTK